MASSSTTGFFQAPPVIPSQYEDDIALRRIISIYLPSPMPKAIDEDLARFSRLVLSKEVLEYVADAERSLPFLQPLTAFGVENKSNPLVTSEGWRMLKNIAIREGLVSLAFEAHTQLTVALIGASESQGQPATEASGSLMLPENHKDVDLILRLLTPVAKAQTALASIAGLRFCMESLGGVGFLENNEDPLLNLARLFRDTCVTAIWEGTGEIMTDDLVRIIKGRSGADTLEALDRWISKAVAPCRQGSLAREAEHLHAAWRTWLQIVQTQDKETLIYQGRDSLETLEIVVAGCCLLLDVAWDKDEVATEIARRWIWGDKTHRYSRAENMEWDKRIVFGVSQPAAHL